MEESILMWNRLESSLRNENQLDKALCFEIRDALWMLTRQWQFGEFEGEDAGTAAYARITGESTPVKGIGPASASPREFDFSKTPFELPVEQENFIPHLSDRIEMGRHWERLLLKQMPAAEAKQVIKQFRGNVRFQFATGLPRDPDRGHRFQHAQKYSDEAWLLLMASVSGGRAIDGYALISELRAGKEASVFLPQSNAVVNAAGKELLQWFERIYGQSAKPNAWHAQHLEYQPQLAYSDSDVHPSVIRKEEYYGEGIEWHGFSSIHSWGEMPDTSPVVLPVQSAETVIPSGVRFRGMPASRVWEMEDGEVDFGAIRATSTELNKMLFAEFGLVYGNDWLIAPVQFPCGSLCRIARLIITDIFGRETVVKEIQPDNNWGFFQTLMSNEGNRWMFLANGSAYIQESSPVEKVSFLRDEMANMVWGVEEVIANPYGGGRDGESLAKQTTQLVRSLQPPADKGTAGKLPSEGWRYKAGTLMAENRIPFIPVVVEKTQSPSLGNRKVVLQRAATPRVSDDFPPVRIRPRTSLLGRTEKPEDQKADPFFIFEEEIPRTGIELSLVWKRVRWFNGQTHTWLARKKTVGKGEIDANFRFDVLRK